MSHHLVEARELSHAYPDGTASLSGITFTIRHGESVAIVGANGAGKSTLLQHLNGTLRATSGEVRVGELPLNTETLLEVRRAVGMVFQDPDDQLFMPTVLEDVAFGPRNLGLSPQESESRALEALRRVGAEHLAAKAPYHLSMGEKRRCAVAAVLSMGPDILVLDEPSTGLDPRGRRLLIGLLGEFTHTKLIATHDLDLVRQLCTRTLVLQDGRLRADGPTHEIFADHELMEDCGLEG
ncbi:MAG: ABC transporter ATP-binding protein [Holophagaceae bacterium]|nr:ABC transporter ATP-binding protein [Holophagaceae bacterium]